MIVLKEHKKVVPVQAKGYELLAKFMHGDADSYTTETYFYETEEELKTAIEFLDWYNKKSSQYHNAYCDLRGDRDIRCSPREEGKYDELQKELLQGEETFSELCYKKGIEFPRDVTSNGDYNADFQRIEDIIYHDGAGLEKRFKYKVVEAKNEL